MSQVEQRFLELVAAREEAKKVLKDSQEEFEQLMLSLGVGSMLQDDKGVVYKIEVPKGRFVSYETIGYKRSRTQDDPKSGGVFLSKTEAQAAGYNI